jgi:hypothetical protein|tara:strand:+ start:620 stop:1093 length:474 start_codon:yes stop_codon:yes gene_type:complete
VLEEKILEYSKEKQAKLLEPAKRAYKKPDIGVEINNKSAYYVIRDCAMITQKYLVLHIWGDYTNPFDELSGKFTKNDVTDFLKRSSSDKTTKQIKDVIISAMRDKFDTTVTTSSSFDYSIEEDDIYGYYGEAEQTDDDFVEQEMTEEEMFLKFFDVS